MTNIAHKMNLIAEELGPTDNEVFIDILINKTNWSCPADHPWFQKTTRCDRCTTDKKYGGEALSCWYSEFPTNACRIAYDGGGTLTLEQQAEWQRQVDEKIEAEQIIHIEPKSPGWGFIFPEK